MKNRLPFLTLLLLLSAKTLVAQSTFTAFPQSDIVDTLWGTPVADPYRWLENLNSDSTKEWLANQLLVTRNEKKKFSGNYLAILNRMLSSGGASFYKFHKQGDYYFQLQYDSRYSTPSLYYKKGVNGYLDVAYSTEDFAQEPITIEDYSISKDGHYLAISLSKAGTDWRTIRVRDLELHKTLHDNIDWIKFQNVVWTDSGFFYSRYKEPPPDLIHVAANSQQQLRFHKLGNAQMQDALIYAIPEQANTSFHFEKVSHFLILYSVTKLKGKWYNTVAYKDLNDGLYAPEHLLLATSGEKSAEFNIVTYRNENFYIETNLDAPRFRVMTCHKDSTNHLEEFIPQFGDVLKEVIPLSKKRMFCLYFNKGKYIAATFDSTGEMIRGLKFTEGWNVEDFQGINDSILHFTQSSFYAPPIGFSLNVNTLQTEVIEQTNVHYDADLYITKIVTYKSKDGTEIPMYLTYKKTTKPNSKTPVLLYGYGGFGISIEPHLNFSNIIFFENDGILAVPMIRGGGELGDEWHNEGKNLNKQNSFDDFISAAEYLINNSYTNKDFLAIEGGSNGGLLVGAMLTQRPDLFKVAIGNVGVYDMMRYQLFTHARYIQREYGTVDDSTEFRNLLKYSPLHNLKSTDNYPATLLLTSANDDRVPPFHTYKFLQGLQDSSQNNKSHILYFNDDAGHNGPVVLEDRYRREAFTLAFIFEQFGFRYPITEF